MRGERRPLGERPRVRVTGKEGRDGGGPGPAEGPARRSRPPRSSSRAGSLAGEAELLSRKVTSSLGAGGKPRCGAEAVRTRLLGPPGLARWP